MERDSLLRDEVMHIILTMPSSLILHLLACRKTSGSIKVAGFTDRLSSLKQTILSAQCSVLQQKKAICNSKSPPLLSSLLLLRLPVPTPTSPLPSLGNPLLPPASAARDIFDAVSFILLKIIIVLWMIMDYYYIIGKTVQSPSDAAAALKPLGYSPSNISGFVGRECTALSDSSKAWYVSWT
jgi:hypothetical protein